MSGPQVTASPGAESQPVPNADVVPPEGIGPADGTPDQNEPRRRRRLLVLFILLGLLAFVLGLALWYLLFRQPIPLPSIPGETVMPGYVTSIYGPDRPLGVAASADGGRVFVGETEGERIARVYDAGGTQLGLMQPPLSTGESHVPVYLATDPLTGEVYVTDRMTASIFVYDTSGTFMRAWTPPAELKGWQPLALAFDSPGNLYVTDVSVTPQSVLMLDRAGKLLRTIGKDANFSFPNGVAVDSAGNVYVTDSNNGRLVVFDPAGKQVAQVGRGVGEGNLGLPRGVVIDDNDRVHVADATGNVVFVYAGYAPGERSLEFLGSFGTPGFGDGQFNFPNGLALDQRGRIYVADSASDRVQVWSY